MQFVIYPYHFINAPDGLHPISLPTELGSFILRCSLLMKPILKMIFAAREDKFHVFFYFKQSRTHSNALFRPPILKLFPFA